MSAMWTDGPGVLRLPSGLTIRGRGLRRPAPEGGQRPDFGVYLLGRAPRNAWETRWVRCPDFRNPSDPADARAAFRLAYERAADRRVEVGCGGGVGRTGLALACLAVLDGVLPEEAVAYVRARYHPRAVETPWQRRFVRRFT
ncbi:protein phosphatase [Actinocorallia aurea]